MTQEKTQATLSGGGKMYEAGNLTNSNEIAAYWLAALIDSADDAIISKTLDGIITSWNKGAERIFGYTAEEVIGKPILILIPPDHQNEEPEILGRIRTGERVEHYETIRKRKDGSLVDISLTVSPIKKTDGTIIGASKIARDISQFKQAEKTLRESEERYRLLFNSIDQGFCVCEVIFDEEEKPIDYRFLEVNPSFEKMTGITSNEALNEKTARELVPNLEDKWVEIYGRIALTGESVNFVDDSDAMGSRWFDVYAFRVGAEPSRKVAIFFNNITERKQAEREREELLRREQIARQQAEEASRLKDEFLATVSHEIRTPLNAILGWSQMLMAKKISQNDMSGAIETIYRNAKSQAQLIEDILDVSRIITGKIRLEARLVSLAPVIQTAVESLRPAIEAKNIRLHMHLDFEPQMVYADPNRLQQVVWNLLSNAIKFTPEKGEVKIKLESDDKQTKIIVADSGKGIDAGFLPFIFERFRQADGSSTRKHGGLGLGLAIVRHIVELHGGQVEVFSAGEDKGATFTVNLPLPESTDKSLKAFDALAFSESETGESEPAVSDGKIKGMRILLIDDEIDSLDLLSIILTQNGAEVNAKTNVQDALEAVKAWRPDAIISDIAMPGEDGYSFIKKLRDLPPEEGGTTPAIALTAYVGIKERTQVLASGFQMYVPKPVEPSELISTLANFV